MKVEKNNLLPVSKTSSLSNLSNLLAITKKILAKYNYSPFSFSSKLHEAHSKEMYEIYLSVDGNYLLTCGDDFTAKLWDYQGKCLQSFFDSHAKVNSVCISNNSKFILTGNLIGAVKFWDKNGTQLWGFNYTDEYIELVRFFEEDTKIFTLSKRLNGGLENINSNIFRIWDLEGRCLVEKIFKFNFTVAVKIIEDANIFLIGDSQRTIIYKYEIDKEIAILQGGITKENLSCIKSGEIILTTSDKKIHFWNCNGTLLKEHSFDNLKIKCSCLSPSGEYYLVATEDKFVILFKYDGSPLVIFSKHTYDPSLMTISQNSEFILTSNYYETFLWNFGGEVINDYTNKSVQIISTFSSDSKQVILGCRNFINIDLTKSSFSLMWNFNKIICKVYDGSMLNDKCYYYIDYNSIIFKDLKGEIVLEYSFDYSIKFAAFSKSGKFLITNDKNSIKSFVLWDLQDSLSRTITNLNNNIEISFYNIEHNLIFSTLNGRTKVWRLEEDDIIRIVNGHEGLVLSCIFSHDEKYIISVSDHFEYHAIIWDIYGNKLAKLVGDFPCVLSKSKNWVDMTSDTSYIFFGGSCWNIHGSEVFSFNYDYLLDDIEEDAGLKGCFSLDNKLLLTGAEDKLCKLWNLQGNCLAVCRGHKNIIKALCFSADGNSLISAGSDGVVFIWDLQGNILQILNDHKENISSIICSSDNKYLFAFGGSITVWEKNNLSQKFIVIDK
ncbi:MAG: hypothetical protein WAW07_05790 [Bacteroidales bacterium]